MKIAVTDASIFIDLYELDGLRWIKILELEVHTSNWVLNELDTAQLRAVEQIVDCTYTVSLDEIQHLKAPRGLSDADCSLLSVAERLPKNNFILLTGDNLIRKWCHSTGKEVHGILWIIDLLIEREMIEPKEGVILLHKLRKINQWLPQTEILNRIDHWSAL